MANADTLKGADAYSGNALDAAKLQNNSETTKDKEQKKLLDAVFVTNSGSNPSAHLGDVAKVQQNSEITKLSSKKELPPSSRKTRFVSDALLVKELNRASQQKQPIEKGILIDKVGALSTTLPSNGSSLVSVGKGTKKIGIITIFQSKSCYYNHFSVKNLIFRQVILILRQLLVDIPSSLPQPIDYITLMLHLILYTFLQLMKADGAIII